MKTLAYWAMLAALLAFIWHYPPVCTKPGAASTTMPWIPPACIER